MLEIVVCDCEVIFTFTKVAEMYPLLSSAITSTVCCPGAAKICVLIEFVNVKYTASWSTYTRIKKIGFLGDAEAVTLNGEVRLPPETGFVIVNGKSFDPGGGGSWAGGAGSGLVWGDHVIGTGGTEG